MCVLHFFSPAAFCMFCLNEVLSEDHAIVCEVDLQTDPCVQGPFWMDVIVIFYLDSGHSALRQGLVSSK